MDDHEALKSEYGRSLKPALQEIVNIETAKWDGRSQRPIKLAEAETRRDTLDIELAKVADKFRPA